MESEEFQAMAAAEDHMWWYRGLHRWLIDRLQSQPMPRSAALLDCGAGTGGFTHNLLAQMPDLQVMGLDLDPSAVRYYASKTARPGVRGSVNDLPFSSGAFDVIVCSDVLYHKSVDELAAVQELYRCLTAGGSLLVNLPAYNWMRSAHDVHVHTARRYTVSRARTMLEDAGFEIPEASYRNSLLFPIMALWRLTGGRLSDSSDVGRFPVWQEHLFSRIIGLENRAARLGVRFPFGGSVYIHAKKPFAPFNS